jgi:hypothetical protein
MRLGVERLKELLLAYRDLNRLYLKTYKLLCTLRDELKDQQYTLEDVVSLLYVMRSVSKYANDLRKEADGIGSMFENVCCVLWMAQHQNAPEQADPIRTALATGTPRINMGVKLPKQSDDPEAFKALMSYFGVSESAVNAQAVKLHWPGICEHLTQLAEDGKPLPPGISADRTYPTYGVTIRANQDLDELIERFKGRRLALQEKLLTAKR